MKKFLFFVVIFICCTSALAAQDYKGQGPDYGNSVPDEEVLKNIAILKTVINTNPAYELYKTQNMWTFLKLETATGRIWQVQYSVSDGDNSFQVVLNDLSLAFDGIEISGRFKLYPTENIYNFLLLDTSTGSVWQAQWSQNPNNRGVIPIRAL